MQDVFKKDKLIWEAKIRAFEKQYISMFSIEQMPKYTINFITDTSVDVNYVMQIINSKYPYQLNINMGFLLLPNYNIYPTLVHEFTHMHDYFTLLNDVDTKYKKNVLSIYSEYHASYQKSIYIFNKLGEKSLLFELDNIIKLAEESIAIFSNCKTVPNWKAIIDSYMYYYGALVAYNNISSTKLNCLSFNFIMDEFFQLFYQIASMNFPDNTRIFEVTNKLKKISDQKLISIQCHIVHLPYNVPWIINAPGTSPVVYLRTVCIKYISLNVFQFYVTNLVKHFLR